MSKRKQIRVTIPEGISEQFDTAKAASENEAMMAMTDTQYATRLLVWAISQQGKVKNNEQ